MDKILEVKNLCVSFRTGKGTLRAVRDISFSLARGETLAVVGESGSGKSVTSKAILGVLAANATDVSGEINYLGKNLLSLSEREMCGIRGNKISMVFQDPLSTLNPIVKIGKQITEGMILKNRKERNSAHLSLKKAMRILISAKSKSYKCKDKFTQTKALRRWLLGRSVKLDTERLAVELTELISAVYELPERLNELLLAIGEEDMTAAPQKILARTLRLIELSRKKISKSMAREKALELMREVGISEPEKRYEQYPFEFSGGMRQRIVIAIALCANPDILICDEPTTALDVTIQAQILELINKLKKERRLSVIFITHDLGVVANVADKIAVMYAGKIVEEGSAEDIFYDPRHPYTWALLSSMPDLDTKGTLDAIPGTAPDMTSPPPGDAFAERSRYALNIDFIKEPPFFEISETHRAASWLLHPDAPRVPLPKTLSERIEKMKRKAE